MALAARPVVHTDLCVTARERPHGLLRRTVRTPDPVEDPTLEALLALTRRAATDAPMWLTGGEPCLRLCKIADKSEAKQGEIIQFTLRFDNVGDQVIGNVTIVDNLSTRFEYIAESAQSSVDANFVTEANDGSLILRWEITNPVEPGEGGVLRFRVRVR